MKQIDLLRGIWLAAAGAVVACSGGVSTIGQGEDESAAPEVSQGGSGSTLPVAPSKGGTMAIGPSMTGAGGSGAAFEESFTAGKAASGGATAPSAGTLCQLDLDCPGYGVTCEECSDGSFACDKTFCSGERCVQVATTCNIPCKYDMECTTLDKACTACGDGSYSCPVGACVAGACQTIVPNCGPFEPCKDQPCGAMCLFVCPDGNCPSNVASFCDGNGQCQQGVPQCGNSEECRTASDCPDAPVGCVTCDKHSCAEFDCVSGKCVFACPANPEPECMNNGDCAPVVECKQCPSDGGCAVTACLDGSCALVCPLMH